MAKIALVALQKEREADMAGDLAGQLLQQAGHAVTRESLQADLLRLKGLLVAALADPRFDALILVGDLPHPDQERVTATLEQLLERRLPGFEHSARHLLHGQEGSELIFSWFCAGSHSGRLVLALPGGPTRLSLLLQQLVLPQFTPLLQWADR